jgi:uncharacterized protein (DUF1697 family)
MPVYVTLLRGINVGPHKRIKMERLRGSFEALGFEQVKTYIQSGNVVFKTARVSPARLSKQIEERILKDFGFSVSIVTRTADELKKAIDDNPFLGEKGIEVEKLHVVFLSDVPAPAALEKLTELIAGPERFQCLGKEIFFHLPNGTAESVLMKHPIDRILQVVPTTRNWRTVNQLAQMCEECR